MSPRAAGMLRLAELIESFVVWIGRVAGWLTLLMVLLTVVVVVMRYFFDAGRIWMQELVTWSHAAVFLLGAAYTLARDDHVRVDVLYRRVSVRARAWINIVGTLLFLFPVCVFMANASASYALKSWQIAERSVDSGGLPYPWIPLGKTLLFAMFALLLVEGVAIVLRNWRALRTGEFTKVAAPQHEDVL